MTVRRKKGSTGLLRRRYLPVLWVLGLWLITCRRTTDATTPPSLGSRQSLGLPPPIQVIGRGDDEDDSDGTSRRLSSACPDSNGTSSAGRGGWRFPSLQRIQILRRNGGKKKSALQEQQPAKQRKSAADDHRWTIPGQRAFRVVRKRGRRAWELLVSSSGRQRTAPIFDCTAKGSSSASGGNSRVRAYWSFPGKQAMDWLRQKRRGGHSSRSSSFNDVDDGEPQQQESYYFTNAPTPPAEPQRHENPSIQLLTVDAWPGDHYATISVIDTSSSDTKRRQQQQDQRQQQQQLLELDTVTTVRKMVTANSTASMQPAWRTLALLSDQVVLVVDSGSRQQQQQDGVMHDSSFWNALLAGWKQRQRVGLSRGQLVVVVAVDDDDDNNNKVDKMRIFRENIVLRRPELTPDILGNFEILSHAEYSFNLETIPLTDSTSSIVELEALEAVVRQAYRELGGEEELFLELDMEERSNRTASLDEAESGFAYIRSSNSVSEPSLDKLESPSFSKDNANTVAEDEKKEIVNGRPKRSRSGWGLPFFRRKRKDAFSAPSSEATGLQPKARGHCSATDQAALQSIYGQLDNLQTLQESNLLDGDTGNLPIDFASHADPILDALAILQPVPTHISDLIQARLSEMYQQHMERLRDHFGKMYETLLEHQHPKAWDAVRARVVSSFRETAAKAVPKLAREGGIFRDMDLDYIVTLAGLESDLEAITELRRELSDDDEENETDVETESSRRRKRILRICKRIAARALVLGVNYLQGWLAWQGIKRAALERERNFPKFPLF